MTKSAQYWKPSIVVFLAAALVPGLACKRGPLPEAKPPVPPITGMQLGPGLPGSAPLQALRAYADSLKFNTEPGLGDRSEEHTSELQSRSDLVCRLLLEKKKK